MKSHLDSKLFRMIIAFSALVSLQGCCVFSPHIANIVPNPGFETGNTGFTSQYKYETSNDDAGDYFVGATPNQYNSNWSASIAPHTGHAMMILDGATSPNTIAWASPTLPVRPYTTYKFSVFLTSLFQSSPAVLRMSINGVPIGPDFSPSPSVGEWSQVCFTWKSDGNTSAVLSLTDENTTYYGNDFAIDDVSFGTIQKMPARGTRAAPTPERLPQQPAPPPAAPISLTDRPH